MNALFFIILQAPKNTDNFLGIINPVLLLVLLALAFIIYYLVKKIFFRHRKSDGLFPDLPNYPYRTSAQSRHLSSLYAKQKLENLCKPSGFYNSSEKAVFKASIEEEDNHVNNKPDRCDRCGKSFNIVTRDEYNTHLCSSCNKRDDFPEVGDPYYYKGNMFDAGSFDPMA